MVLALKRTEIDVTDLNDHIHHITLPDSIFRSENYNAIQKPELAIIFANLSLFFLNILEAMTGSTLDYTGNLHTDHFTNRFSDSLFKKFPFSN